MSGCYPTDTHVSEKILSMFQTQYEWNNHTKNRIDSLKNAIGKLMFRFDEWEKKSKVQIEWREDPLHEQTIEMYRKENENLKTEINILVECIAKKDYLLKKLREDNELMIYRMNEANGNCTGSTL